MKSKKYIVTSIATATLGLALLTDTAGMSPFSIRHFKKCKEIQRIFNVFIYRQSSQFSFLK